DLPEWRTARATLVFDEGHLMADSSEAEILRRIGKLIGSCRAADLYGVMSSYVPDVVTFDIVAPLRKIGADGKRENWRAVFATYQRPLGYEARDLKIAHSGRVGGPP